MSDFSNIDVDLLKEVVEAVNKTTESLKESYSLLQKKLEHTQGLLDSVLDKTNSAIIAQDDKNGVFLKNRRAKELIEELGSEKVFHILSLFSTTGVHDYDDEGRRYFRLSVSALSYDNLTWQITRRFNNNMQTLQTQDNLVVTVDREQQLPPAQMTVSGIQQAVNETVTVWNADDLQCDLQRIGTAGSAAEVVSLAAPELPAQHAQQLTSSTAFLNILQ